MKKMSANKIRVLCTISLIVVALLFPVLGVPSVGSVMSAINSIVPTGLLSGGTVSGVIGINGVQVSLAAGLFFSFLGDVLGLVGFPKFLLGVLSCTAIMAPAIMAVVCLFMTIFSRSKKAKTAIMIMQFISLAINFFLMFVYMKLVKEVNDVSILTLGFGSVVMPILNLVAAIFAMLWRKSNAAVGTVANRVEAPQGSIVCLAGEYIGNSIPLAEGESLIIGRDSSVSNVILNGDKISRAHCSITYNKARNRYIVTDTSTNGTYVRGGSRLPKDKPSELIPGTIIQIGNDDNSFRLQ